MSNLEQLNAGIRIGGRQLNDLRYADDTTLMAGDRKDLQEILKRLRIESEKVCLYLKTKKTKMMSNVVGAELNLGDDVGERVDRFVLLGSQVDMKTGSRYEIKRELAMGRAAMKWQNIA